MSKAQILRLAADYLISGTCGYNDGPNRFMCCAVAHAEQGEHWSSCPEWFKELIGEHGVETGGNLNGYDTGKNPIEAQGVRFDFLNLLAESLSDAE